LLRNGSYYLDDNITIGGRIMYKIEVNHVDKTFTVTLEGSIGPEESAAYLTEMGSRLLERDFSEYYMIVDSSGLKVSSQDMEDHMKKGMGLVLSTPFKGRFNIVPKSAITNLQANRIGKEFELKENLTMVQSYEEIVELLNK
jgi:hypothetical protein